MEYKTSDLNTKDVVTLLTRFLDESVFEGRVATDNVVKVLSNKDKFLTIVAYKELEPVGIFVGYTYEHPLFVGDYLSGDLLVYVIPEYRGSLVATRFVKKYIQWATNKGVRYIQLGQTTGVGNIERVKKFYESMGFKTVGFNTLKEV